MQVRFKDGIWEKLVFTPFITRNGKRIYRKKGRVFAFWVPLEK